MIKLIIQYQHYNKKKSSFNFFNDMLQKNWNIIFKISTNANVMCFLENNKVFFIRIEREHKISPT